MMVWHTTLCGGCEKVETFQVEITRREQEIPRTCPCGHVRRFNYVVYDNPDGRYVAAVPTKNL